MLKDFQTYANGNLFVDKTLRTRYTIKEGGFSRLENRLWIWFAGAESPVLVKEDWLTGNNSEDLKTAFKAYMSC